MVFGCNAVAVTALRKKMFRNTTKQIEHSQADLKKNALKALSSSNQIHNDDIHTQTYDRPLPNCSVSMLNNIVVPLTAGTTDVEPSSRLLYTAFILRYNDGSRLRMFFLQPEISSATCNLQPSTQRAIVSARSRLVASNNRPAGGRIVVTSNVCQVIGRISPYVCEAADEQTNATWSYFNASKSRFLFTLTRANAVRLMSMTKDYINILRSMAVNNCAFVYSHAMKCYKITATPPDYDTTSEANKSTCIMLYNDGSFKIVGTPMRARDVCMYFRETMLKAHTSPLHQLLVSNLLDVTDVIEDAYSS